jgi:hypothetical protein
MTSSWDAPDAEDRTLRGSGRPEPDGRDGAETPPDDDHWLEEGLERRRARRKRADPGDEEG